jgi:hypothetical protein
MTCAAVAATISSGAGYHDAPVERARLYIRTEHLLPAPPPRTSFSAGASHPCSRPRNKATTAAPVCLCAPPSSTCFPLRFHAALGGRARHIILKVFKMTSTPTEQRLAAMPRLRNES